MSVKSSVSYIIKAEGNLRDRYIEVFTASSTELEAEVSKIKYDGLSPSYKKIVKGFFSNIIKSDEGVRANLLKELDCQSLTLEQIRKAATLAAAFAKTEKPKNAKAFIERYKDKWVAVAIENIRANKAPFFVPRPPEPSGKGVGKPAPTAGNAVFNNDTEVNLREFKKLSQKELKKIEEEVIKKITSSAANLMVAAMQFGLI